jgi:hypothetical protein
LKSRSYLGALGDAEPNESRQPTPGERLGPGRSPVARRGCALRWGLVTAS